MKKTFFVFMVLGLALCLAVPALCEEEGAVGDDDTYGYGRGMGRGSMMDNDHHYGMPGRRRGYMRPRAWKSMKPEQREKCEKMRAEHLMDTLELRKKLAAKQVELKTLWAQPKVDDGKIEKLSDEIAGLSAELSKKRDKHLLKCRKELGDLGWHCPGGRW
jgi:hypothetical protein